MCYLASWVFDENAKLYACPETQHHEEIAVGAGLLSASLDPFYRALLPDQAWGRAAFRGELNPPDWRAGREGRWYDGPHVRIVPHPVPNAPQKIIDAGERIAQELITTEGPVKSMPWITIVRGGKHHLATVEYLCTFGSAEVEVDHLWRGVWAMEDSRVTLHQFTLSHADRTASGDIPIRVQDNAVLVTPEGVHLRGFSMEAKVARNRAAAFKKWHTMSPLQKARFKSPMPMYTTP